MGSQLEDHRYDTNEERRACPVARYWTALSSIVFDAAFAFGGMLVVVVVVVVDIELVGSLGPLGLSLLKSPVRAPV